MKPSKRNIANAKAKAERPRPSLSKYARKHRPPIDEVTGKSALGVKEQS